MKIIIEVKDTATLSRIESFCKDLEHLPTIHDNTQESYYDVIKSISKEW